LVYSIAFFAISQGQFTLYKEKNMIYNEIIENSPVGECGKQGGLRYAGTV
jgi:hypothetical protein